MAQYNITIDSVILHQFFRGAKRERMAKLLESVLNQILEAQAAERIQAGPDCAEKI